MSNFFDKMKYYIGISDEYEDDEYEDDEYEDDDYEDDLEIDRPVSKTNPFGTKNRNADNIVSISQKSPYKIQVHEPLEYEEAPLIIDDLRNRKAVVVNFEQLDPSKKRQVFDFINGGIYSIEGKIQKVTKDIFILAPKSIEIDGLKTQLKDSDVFTW